ncbi:MAG: hypothetical protein AAGH17_05375 [Pseudomonadota bacterium]
MPPSDLETYRCDGFVVFDHTPEVAAWARSALKVADEIKDMPEMQRTWLRHQKTWFVGVDALPNAPDGSIAGTPLTGPWEALVAVPQEWHRAQLSIVYPGYPGCDPDESDAAHRFRHRRCAAHVDGLLPEGPDRRRYLREPHAFVLGLPLDNAQASPLVVWPGSHLTMGAAFRKAAAGRDITRLDVTDTYQAVRRTVFDTIAPVEVMAKPGQSVLLHRHVLHGVKPWDPAWTVKERKVAYFRPQFDDPAQWLGPDP